MLTVVVLAALIYFVSVGVTGKWIYSNIAVPIFSYFGISTSSTTPEGTDSLSGFSDISATSSPTANTSTVEKTVSIAGYTDYMIQLGAYDNEDGAKTDAASYKLRGAAGYIVLADKYRIIAASYETQDSANSIKDSLKSQDSLDSVVYEYSVPKLEFKITATQSQITAIETVFNYYIQLKNNIGDLAASLDKSGTDISGVKSKLKEYLTVISEYKTNISALAKGNSDNKIISGLNTLYTTIYDDINNINSASYSSKTTMSADLKYVNVKMTDKYAAFLKDITN